MLCSVLSIFFGYKHLENKNVMKHDVFLEVIKSLSPAQIPLL